MALPLLIRLSLPAGVIALVPQAALGCPYCAGRSQGGMWTNVILGAFVFLPFLVSWAIYRIVRAHDDDRSTPESRRQAS
jgi:hypothetical protein